MWSTKTKEAIQRTTQLNSQSWRVWLPTVASFCQNQLRQMFFSIIFNIIWIFCSCGTCLSQQRPLLLYFLLREYLKVQCMYSVAVFGTLTTQSFQLEVQVFSTSENQILPAHLTAQRQTVVTFLSWPVFSDKVTVPWHMDMAYVLKIKSYIKHSIISQVC